MLWLQEWEIMDLYGSNQIKLSEIGVLWRNTSSGQKWWKHDEPVDEPMGEPIEIEVDARAATTKSPGIATVNV